MRTSQEWLNQYRAENPDRVHDPFEEERDDGPTIYSCTWEIEMLPPLYNECLRLFKHNPTEYYSSLHEWEETLSVLARQEKGPGAIIATPTEIHMVRYSSSPPDVDGLYGSFKLVLDALVNTGLIPDDDPSVVARLEADHEVSEDSRVVLRFTTA